MKNKHAKILLAAVSAAAVLPLAACQTPVVVSFDEVAPWHDSEQSYEKLEYDVSVYDMTGDPDAYIEYRTASGSLTFTLEEAPIDNVSYTTLTTDMSLKYKPTDDDIGYVDSVSSTVLFQTASLVSSRMEKTVTVEPRPGETENDSYKVTADYFGDHVATRTIHGETDTMDIPAGMYYDNEAMFFLARATNVTERSTNTFYMCNIFDSFLRGSFTSYTMVANVAGGTDYLNIGEWVTDYGINTQSEEDWVKPYYVPYYNTTIMMNDAKHGPAYTVAYSAVEFKKGEKAHKKIPLKIVYDRYTGTKLSSRIEYTLKALAFEKE